MCLGFREIRGRIGSNAMLLTGPLAKINQAAAFTTKWSKRRFFIPFDGFITSWAFNNRYHNKINNK